MAIDQSTQASAIRDLNEHRGHEIELAFYATGVKDAVAKVPSNASIECMTCSEVLIDFDLSKEDPGE